jgi:hypothetical protein
MQYMSILGISLPMSAEKQELAFKKVFILLQCQRFYIILGRNEDKVASNIAIKYSSTKPCSPAIG